MKYNETSTLVKAWAEDKQLLDENNALKQFQKLMEEANEVFLELLTGDNEALKLEVGDLMIATNILCAVKGLDPEECFEKSYHKIKNRKGKTVDGRFLKETV